MARMFPETCPATRGGTPVATAERQTFERLTGELDAGWSVLYACPAGADGSLRVDFVLISRQFGIALLDAGAATPKGQEEVIAVFRARLDALGFSERFRGHLAIVARALRPEEGRSIRTLIERLFIAAEPTALADPTWPDWLTERLVTPAEPPRAARPGPAADERAAATTNAPRLRAPAREEAWRVREAAAARRPAADTTPTMSVAPDRRIVSEAGPARGPLLVGMGFAVLVVALVLVGMALLAHGNGP